MLASLFGHPRSIPIIPVSVCGFRDSVGWKEPVNGLQIRKLCHIVNWKKPINSSAKSANIVY